MISLNFVLWNRVRTSLSFIGYMALQNIKSPPLVDCPCSVLPPYRKLMSHVMKTCNSIWFFSLPEIFLCWKLHALHDITLLVAVGIGFIDKWSIDLPLLQPALTISFDQTTHLIPKTSFSPPICLRWVNLGSVSDDRKRLLSRGSDFRVAFMRWKTMFFAS